MSKLAGNLRWRAAAMAVAVAAGTMLSTGTTSAASASSCDPKTDYEYLATGSTPPAWFNVCGFGTWPWPFGSFLTALRMPTTPYYRIWLHQNSDGTGLSACFYSEDTDVYMADYVAKYGNWIEEPGNLQVTSNTNPC